MRLLLPLSLALFGTGAGVAVGHLLKPDVGVETAAAVERSAQTPADGAHAQPGPIDAHDGVDTTDGSTEFVKLNNQFIVPVIDNGRVRSMVLLSLTLETTTGNKEAIFAREPKLRDGFLQVLFDYANAGGFDGTFTSARAMDHLRAALREEGRRMTGEILRDVLVTDIARQDS